MKLSKANVPFTMVANEVLARPDLSLKAKGLFAYLFSKPEGWDFSADRIAMECQEERKTVQRILQELAKAGLLTRTKHRDGRMEYHLSYGPEPERSQSLFIATDRVREVPVVVAPTPSPIDGLNDLMREFEPLNPSFQRLFANKTQRAALTRLVQAIGFDETRNAIRAAAATFGRKYAPTISTPMQLEEKLGTLAAFVKREGGPAVMAI